MFITYPDGCFPVNQVYGLKVPVWANSTSIDRDLNVFYARRVSEARKGFTALTHAKFLTDSIYWQNGLPAGYQTKFPCGYSSNRALQSWVDDLRYREIVPGATGSYLNYYLYDMWKLSADIVVTTQISVYMRSYDVQHHQLWVSSATHWFLIHEPAQRRYARYTCTQSWSLGGPTTIDDGIYTPSHALGDAATIIASRRPDIGDFHVDYIQERNVERCSVPDEKSLNAIITIAQRQMFLFEDPSLVDASVMTTYEAALRSQRHKVYSGHWHVNDLRPIKRPGVPLYAESNIEFLQGRSEAYIDALKDIPTLSQNMIQNLIEAFTILYSFVAAPAATVESFSYAAGSKASYTSSAQWLTKTGNEYAADFNTFVSEAERLARQRKKWSKIRKSELIDPHQDILNVPDVPAAMKKNWLRGRYALSTTVMDGQQAWDYFWDWSQRLLGCRSDRYKCHGKKVIALPDGSTALFQCNMYMKEKALRGVTAALEKMYRYGLEPNAYVMWDLIPLSFVVDWFFPIGDALEAETMASHFTPQFWQYLPEYDGRMFCYSVTYTSQTLLGPVHVYTRWYESSPPDVENAYYFFNRKGPKTGTRLKRVLDGIALFS